jgi:hypothetical protein
MRLSEKMSTNCKSGDYLLGRALTYLSRFDVGLLCTGSWPKLDARELPCVCVICERAHYYAAAGAGHNFWRTTNGGGSVGVINGNSNLSIGSREMLVAGTQNQRAPDASFYSPGPHAKMICLDRYRDGIPSNCFEGICSRISN